MVEKGCSARWVGASSYIFNSKIPAADWGQGGFFVVCVVLLSVGAGTRPGGRLTFFCFAKRK